jgi:uncharacterized protein YjbJ (UPF0337 family)
MAGTIDKAKGRIKEAAGALTDDPALKREGKIDQATGDVKDGIERREAWRQGHSTRPKDASRKPPAR